MKQTRNLLTRRALLGKGVMGFSLAATAPHFLGLTSKAFAADGGSDRILVVVQLSGGNDGLSMVVPYGDPAYYRARNSSAIPVTDVFTNRQAHRPAPRAQKAACAP